MRYVLDPKTRKLIPRSSARRLLNVPNIIPDIEPCRNMIEGGKITSRSQIREIERRHGVRQIGNDWVGEIPRSELHRRG